MYNDVPAYIIKHAEALAKAHESVKRHGHAIENWVDKNCGDGKGFFHDLALDMPYEYNAQETIEALKNI